MSNNIAELVVQVKNLTGDGMQAIATTARSTMNMVYGDITRTQNHLADLAKPVRLQVDTTAVARAGQEIDRVNEKMSFMRASAATAVGMAAQQGLSQAIGLAKETVMSSLDTAMQAGMREKSFDVLTGSAALGHELFADLRHMKQTTLVGGGVYQNAQTMLGFGVPRLEILRDLRQIGDIGMGDQEKMFSLTLARAQVHAAGKLMGQDLLQLINAGFNPLGVMADRWQDFGFKAKVTIGQLKDLMEKGQISSAMVDKAFDVATSQGGRFFHMMEQIGETPAGKMMKMKGEWAAMQIDLGNAMMPLASSVMQEMSGLMKWMEETHAIDNLKPVVDDLTHGFADLVKWTVSHTDTLKTWAGVIKVGAEMYVAWKVGTTALTAANWIWVNSIGAQVVQTSAATAAIQAENVALAEQAELIAALNVEYDAMVVSISGMTAAERAAMAATAANSFNLPINMAGAAGAASAGAAGLAGGFARAVSAAAIPVFITGATMEAGEALGLWKIKPLSEWLMPDALGIEFSNSPYFQEMRRQEQAQRDRESLRNNPQQYASGWDMNNMLGGPAAGHTAAILDKFGVKAPTGKAGAEQDLKSLAANLGSHITGGGRQDIKISFKNVVEHMHLEGATQAEQMVDMEQKLKIMIGRIFRSLPRT